MKRIWWAIGLVFLGCKKEIPSAAKTDNAATRYASGLAISAGKAKSAAEEANRAVAATQAAVDALAEETRR